MSSYAVVTKKAAGVLLAVKMRFLALWQRSDMSAMTQLSDSERESERDVPGIRQETHAVPVASLKGRID